MSNIECRSEIQEMRKGIQKTDEYRMSNIECRSEIQGEVDRLTQVIELIKGRQREVDELTG
jgi:hypothetical protein